MIEGLDDIRAKFDMSLNLRSDQPIKGGRNIRDSLDLHNDDNSYQMFPGRQTATTKSARNHRFQVQSIRRPASLTKQRFEHLTPRQRQRKRQELIERFKSNVTNFMESAVPAGTREDLNQTQPCPAAADTVGDVLG